MDGTRGSVPRIDEEVANEAATGMSSAPLGREVAQHATVAAPAGVE